ncbi:MAG: stage V sporulation protein AB [Lachnospiraceae bacterium]|nr:stage V sporulation protein AB [Lachnospiraceae bacterium]
MIVLKQLFLVLAGLGAGAVVAAGVFALITSVGLMVRLAGKTHTGKYAKVYETCVALGGTFGNLWYLYQFRVPLGAWFLVVCGLAFGVYIGVLVMSLAESLNVTAIFARRIRLSKGIPWVVLGIALGKGLGAWYFYQFMSGV